MRRVEVSIGEGDLVEVSEELIIPRREREAERLRVRRVALHGLPRLRYGQVQGDGRSAFEVEGRLRLRVLVEGDEAYHFKRGRLLYRKVKEYEMSFSLTDVLKRNSESVTTTGMRLVPSTMYTLREVAISRSISEYPSST